MTKGHLYTYSAFTLTPDGGNPAGIWIGESFPDDELMQQIAAELGLSETAFVTPGRGHHRNVRYFSPEIEVPFCGHATIAAGVFLGETCGDGTYRFQTQAGEIPVSVYMQDGVRHASLTSIDPESVPVHSELVNEAISILGWSHHDLDSTIRPAKAFAGAWHLVIAVNHLKPLAELVYDFENLKELMIREDLTTLQLVWREEIDLFHARNPFPVGGVIEDPATGASAAALGGYLRKANLINPPATITVRQGEAMGRPSRIMVHIPTTGGIVVSGTAVKL